MKSEMAAVGEMQNITPLEMYHYRKVEIAGKFKII